MLGPLLQCLFAESVKAPGLWFRVGFGGSVGYTFCSK